MNWQITFCLLTNLNAGSEFFMSNLELSLVILVTGIVVVFSVLVLLILIIKLYSTGVSNAQSKIERRKQPDTPQPAKPETEHEVVVKAAESVSEAEDSIPGEIIAAIAAAVDTVFGEGAVTITSVKKAKKQTSSGSRNAWRAAGVAENTRAF